VRAAVAAGRWVPADLLKAIAPVWSSKVFMYTWGDIPSPDDPLSLAHPLWLVGQKLKGATTIQFAEG
jgi:hypothetical protein